MQRITGLPGALTNETCFDRAVWYSIFTVLLARDTESTGTPRSCYPLPALFSTRIAHKLPRLMTLRAMVTVLLGEEELLSDAVSGKRNCRNAEAREGALEAVKPGEGTRVSPLFAMDGKSAARERN